MPQLGETVVEGTITKWLKKEGDTVERDEPLLEISTDKVDTEVPSPVGGKVVQIKIPEGETVSVGTELAIIESGDGQAGAAQAREREPESLPGGKRAPPAGGPAEARAPVQGDGGAAAAEMEREAPQPAPPAPRAQGTAAPSAEGPVERGPRSQILSPLVRRLAEENQVDLSRVEGTGTGGRMPQ